MTEPGPSQGEDSGRPQLMRQAAVIIRARVLTTLVDSATGLLLARLLAKKELAIVALLLVIYETCKALVTFGLPEGILYFFQKWGPQHRRSVALRTLGLVSAAAVCGALLMVGLASSTSFWLTQWSRQEARQVADYLPFMAVLALLELPSWPVTNILVGLGKTRWAGSYQVATSVMTLAGTLVPVVLGYGVPGLLWGLLVYALLRSLLSIALLAAFLPRQGQAALGRSALGQQLRFSLPLGFGALVGRLNRYVDKAVVAGLLPAAALAEYTVASTEVPLVNAFPYGAATVLIGRYVALWEQRDRGRLLLVWQRGVRIISLLPVPMAALLVLSAPDLVAVLFGEGYEAAVAPFRVLGGLLLFRVANWGALIQSFGNTRVVLSISAAVLATNALLSVPLTLAFGIVGTAAGTLAASLVGLALNLRAISRQLEVHWARVIDLRAYASVLVLACSSSLLGYCLRLYLFPIDRHDGWVLAVLALPSLAMYLGLGSALGVLRRSDWRALAMLVGLR